jgi:hypothetical protein
LKKKYTNTIIEPFIMINTGKKKLHETMRLTGYTKAEEFTENGTFIGIICCRNFRTHAAVRVIPNGIHFSIVSGFSIGARIFYRNVFWPFEL